MAQRKLLATTLAGTTGRAQIPCAYGDGAESIVDHDGRGWCNGSTGSFGVPSRGSKPRPRAGRPRSSRGQSRQRPRECRWQAVARRPVSAVVLAAGEGTRMRSSTPKVLHALCGRPMLLYVLDALGHAAARSHRGGRRPRRRGRHQDRPGAAGQRRSRSSSSSRRCYGAPATPPRVALTAFADDLDADDDLLVMLRRRPAASAPRPSRCSPPSIGSATPAATLLTARLDDPTGYGRVVRDERGNVERIVEQADAQSRRARDRRGEPVDLLLPPRVPRAVAAPAEPRERAGRVLPHRRRGRAARRRATPSPASRSTTPPRCSRSTTVPSSRSRRRSSAARINHRWMREGVTMVDPATTYLDAEVELEPDVRILPNTILGGQHRRARRGGHRARLPARRHGGRARRSRAPDGGERGGDRRARHRRPVRVAAPRHAPRCRCARRHVRRDQEQRDRRGRQGAAPLLRG